jgi:HSP20 family protein
MAQNTNRDPEAKEVQVTGSEGGSAQGRQLARAPRAAEFLPARLFSRGGPFSMMRRLSEEMDRMFEDFFGTSDVPSEWGGWPRARGWPELEMSQTDGELVISADLPGVRNEDVTVEVDRDTLVLRGERRQEHESSGGGLHRSERTYGSFHRAVSLPEGAEVDKAKAEFRNGVLEIRIPAPQHTRRIPISAEGAAN